MRRSTEAIVKRRGQMGQQSAGVSNQCPESLLGLVQVPDLIIAMASNDFRLLFVEPCQF
jgi:hypothetical protein